MVYAKFKIRCDCLQKHSHKCEGDIVLGLVAPWWSRLMCLWGDLLDPQFSKFGRTLPTLIRNSDSLVEWQLKDLGCLLSKYWVW